MVTRSRTLRQQHRSRGPVFIPAPVAGLELDPPQPASQVVPEGVVTLAEHYISRFAWRFMLVVSAVAIAGVYYVLIGSRTKEARAAVRIALYCCIGVWLLFSVTAYCFGAFASGWCRWLVHLDSGTLYRVYCGMAYQRSLDRLNPQVLGRCIRFDWPEVPLMVCCTPGEANKIHMKLSVAIRSFQAGSSSGSSALASPLTPPVTHDARNSLPPFSDEGESVIRQHVVPRFSDAAYDVEAAADASAAALIDLGHEDDPGDAQPPSYQEALAMLGSPDAGQHAVATPAYSGRGVPGYPFRYVPPPPQYRPV